MGTSFSSESCESGSVGCCATLKAKTTEKFAFCPQKSYEWDRFVKDGKGDNVAVLYKENAENDFTILYSHGNAEDLQDIQESEIWEFIFDPMGANFLAYEYPGYGTQFGHVTPTERQTFVHARAAFDYLTKTLGIPSETIILMGKSLGSGPTTHLAQELCKQKIPIAGMILQCPLKSAVRVPFDNSCTPSLSSPIDIFKNINKISDVTCPTLIIHGDNDKVIDVSHGRDLAEKSPNLWKFVEIKGAGHNDLDHYLEFNVAIQDFCNTLRA